VRFAASPSPRWRRVALGAAAVAGGFLGFWYVAYAYWLAVGSDSGLLERSAWHRLFVPGIWSVYRLGAGWAVAAVWTLLGATAGLGAVAVFLRRGLHAQGDAPDRA
jgi:hypothetical protein